MTVRIVSIHDKCTMEGCNKTLHSIIEGERGTCSSCWIKSMPNNQKQAMNKLIASAFNGSTEKQKEKAVEEALEFFPGKDV